MTIGSGSVPMSGSVSSLGITLDCHLTMKTHISSMVRSASFELLRISSIRHFLSIHATKTLVSAFVLSRLDSYDHFVSGCQWYLWNKLQKVEWTLLALCWGFPKLITFIFSSSCFSPLTAQWFTNTVYTNTTFVWYNCLNSTAPGYLAEVLKVYNQPNVLLLIVKCARTCLIMQISFSVPALSVWKS